VALGGVLILLGLLSLAGFVCLRSQPEQKLGGGLPKKPMEASTICVENLASFALYWQMWDTKTNEVSDEIDKYPSTKWACKDISDLQTVSDGDPIVLHALASSSYSQTFSSVIYKSGLEGPERYANFTCKGSAMLARGGFSCALDGAGEADIHGAMQMAKQPPDELVRAGGVCVLNDGAFQMTFTLWDTMTNEHSERQVTFNKNQEKCLSGDVFYLSEEGNPLVVDAIVTMGRARALPAFIYDPSAENAKVVCSGGAENFKCELEKA
jgi:hypothetical protein